MTENQNNIENTEITEITKITEDIENPENVETPETEETEKKIKPGKKAGKNGVSFKDTMLGTTVILGAITFITAFMLAVMNSFTGPVIARRLADEKKEAIASLFGDDMLPDELPGDIVEKEGGEEEPGIENIYKQFPSVNEILLIKNSKSDKFAGYFITVTSEGFAGKIIMLVAVNPDITVRDTKILDMNETPGIGPKIDDEKWREQFKHKTKDIKIDKNGVNAINAVAGATKSSEAFVKGVNEALAAADEIKKRMLAAKESIPAEDPEDIDETENGEDIDDIGSDEPDEPDKNGEEGEKPDE